MLPFSFVQLFLCYLKIQNLLDQLLHLNAGAMCSFGPKDTKGRQAMKAGKRHRNGTGYQTIGNEVDLVLEMR